MCGDYSKATAPASATPATPAFPFKKGDKVRVTRKIASNTEGWKNVWVDDPMTKAIGKEFEVLAVYPRDNDVHLRIPGGLYGFPVAGLELVKTPSIQDVITAPAGLSRQGQALFVAKTVAVNLAKKEPSRTVTADVVQAELGKLGFKSTELGNAAGTIFKGPFRAVGTTKSTREGNNRRKITVWQYVGA